MATMPGKEDGNDWLNSKYTNLLIKPMSRDDSATIRVEHVVDAGLVAAIVFFAILLGDIYSTGFPTYVTIEDLIARMPTAIIAFFLTFFAQWARARGIDVLGRFRDLVG